MTCGQADCTAPACSCALWPGRRDLIALCWPHHIQAIGIAAHLGFVLDVRPLEALEAALAAETIDTLKGRPLPL